MSFDEYDDVLLGAIVLTLLGQPEDDALILFNSFDSAMSVYGYTTQNCYRIATELEEAYNEHYYGEA